MRYLNQSAHLFLFLSGIAFSSFGGDGDDTSLHELKKKAEKEFALEHYHNAADLLIKVIEKAPMDAWAHYELGISYLHTNSFEAALLHIKKAYEIDPKHGVDKTYHYWLGKAYHQNHQFPEAIKEYETYENTFRKKDDRRDELKLYKSQAYIGQHEYNNPKNVVVLNLGVNINTPFDEHSPIIADEGQTIYFTSKKYYQGHETQDDKGEYFETIFITTRDDKGVWSSPEVVGGVLDMNESHDACIQIFDNNKKMLMYRDTDNGSIYIAEKDETGTWHKADPLEMINTGKTENDATISQDGSLIIFSRDAAGRRYDMNLWYTKKDKNGKWSEPVELSGTVNTTYDEQSPFLSPDGKTFYFASNGPRSMGGYDIFKCDLQDDGKWSDPVNLGFPINTVYHDLYYQENTTRTMAIFSSHREGGQGELDVYAMYPVQMVELHGKIDQELVQGKDSMHVYLNSVGENQLPFSADLELKTDGEFKQQVVSNNTYDVIITNGSEIINKEKIIVEKTMEKGKTQDYVVKVNKTDIPEEGVKMELTSDEIIAYLEQGFGVSLVLFDFNKTELKKESIVILDRLTKELADKPAIKVTLLGHTDNIGSEAYNKKLSKERAATAAAYISQKGVDKTRIFFDGKGSSAPLVPNDTEQGRARNRRVEMRFTTTATTAAVH